MKFNDLPRNFLQSFPNQRANLRSIVRFPATENQFAQLSSHKIGHFNNKTLYIELGRMEKSYLALNLFATRTNYLDNETSICLRFDFREFMAAI